MRKVTQEELTEKFLETLEAQNRRAKGLPVVKIKAMFLGEDDPLACYNGKIYNITVAYSKVQGKENIKEFIKKNYFANNKNFE